MVKVSKLAVDGPMVVSVPELLQKVDILVQFLYTIRRKIRLIEGTAKYRRLKWSDGRVCSRAPAVGRCPGPAPTHNP